ncbi:cyclophane-forming radical SAM peptide maturase AmcB [Streptoverticillium reticulum]|uniref:cyclophane-forming radical SAM peptide maturase AmcB n=1 Tax=Streptoverticillium reticulum TaxID=1433415 RepID=UPI0039BF5BA9
MFVRLAAIPKAVIMQPTTLCSLDCRYCYLPFRKVNHRMPLEVAAMVAASVNPWAALQPGFEVVWHGGEPLTAGRSLLGALMEPFEGVTHTLQTNATLVDDRWCDFFEERGVGVGVSIDGPADMNRNRASLGGRPAHDRIIRGIGRLRERGVPFSAIAVVSDPDPARAAEFYRFFVDLGCDVLGVNVEEQEGVHTRASEPDPGRAAQWWVALTDAWRADPAIRVREIDRVLTFASAVLEDRIATNTVQVWDPLPTVAYDGGVVLVSPELAGFTDPRLGDFTTGNVLSTPLDVLLAEAESRTPWLAEFQRGVDSCRTSCSFFDFCGGGHPANRYFEHGGRMDGTRTTYCTTAKIALLEGVTAHVNAHSN